MIDKRLASATALAVALGWALPSQAQAQAAPTTNSVREELAQMRAQMQRMADRIDTLEGQLAAANAKADAATQAAASATTTAAAAQTAAAKAPPIKVAWKGAPEFSAEGGWSFKPRGRMQIDVGSIHVPKGIANAQQLGTSVEARRFFLGFEGTIPGGFGYRAEADLATSGVVLNDVYFTYRASKNLTFMVGNHRPFWGMDEVTSDLFTSMMERAAYTQAFGFERRLGASATYSTDKLLVQGGVFSDDPATLNDDTAKGWSVDGRVVFMPKVLGGTLHLGVSGHLRDLAGSAQNVRYRARPFLHTTDLRLVDTGGFGATGERSLGAEFAYVSGRFHAAAESHWLAVRRANFVSPSFNGGYGEVGLLLTDDQTAYKAGQWERIKPRKPLGKGGLGALQLNARYDWLDLTDAGFNGGRQQVAGLSLIWMPTEYVRFIANYGHIWLRGAAVKAAGDPNYAADAFGMRAQIDF